MVCRPENAPADSKSLLTIRRYTAKGDLIALFFGVVESENLIRGCFVNTFDRGGRFVMRRVG